MAVDHYAVADRYAVVAHFAQADRYAAVAHFAQADRYAAGAHFAQADRCAAVHMSAARPPLVLDLTTQARLDVTWDRAVVLIRRFVRALLVATRCQL